MFPLRVRSVRILLTGLFEKLGQEEVHKTLKESFASYDALLEQLLFFQNPTVISLVMKLQIRLK
jgi:hypothetical protein